MKKTAVFALRIFVVLLLCIGLTHTRSIALTSMDDVVSNLFGENAQTLDIVILLTVLSLVPSMLIVLTGYTRILIVLSIVRSSMGMQQSPPNQVLIGIAIFLTFFVMRPTLDKIYQEAYVPYSEGEIDMRECIDLAAAPLREFMLKETHVTDLDFFINLSGEEGLESYEDVPTSVLIPAFVTSEIKIAFKIGFFIYIPFIVIDMVVASTLMAMGMMMLPPAMISLPFKILLFVMVDGWQLVMSTLVNSFNL